MSAFPSTTIFVWGVDFPYEAIFPVISPPDNKYRFNMLGVFAPAPFSISYNDYKRGRGMANQFKSENGMQIIADDNKIKILATYCAERLSGKMQILSKEKYAYVTVNNIKCNIPNNPKEKL